MKERIEDFLNAMRSERGLAVNTLDGYGRDLRRYAVYLSGEGLKAWERCGRDHLTGHLSHLKRRGCHPATICRASARFMHIRA